MTLVLCLLCFVLGALFAITALAFLTLANASSTKDR